MTATSLIPPAGSGESYMQARNFNKAADYFEKASALQPKAANLRTSLALSKLGKGDQAQAVSDLQLATKLDAKSQQAGIALVRTELGLQHFDNALAAAGFQLEGDVLMGQNKPTQALPFYEQALGFSKTSELAIKIVNALRGQGGRAQGTGTAGFRQYAVRAGGGSARIVKAIAMTRD